MYYQDLFKQIFFNLWAHKIRSALALFGIMWGTCTVIVLLSFSNGFYDEQIKNLAFLNNATIFAWGGTTSKPFGGLPQGQKIHLQLNDVLAIVHDVPGVKYFSPVFNQTSNMHYQDKETSGTILGVAPGFDTIMQIELTPGSRFINTVDIAQSQRVLFLDESVKTLLFGNKEALFKTIVINNLPFTVIGVAAPHRASGLRWGENNVYVPYSTFLAIYGQQDIRTIFLLPQITTDVPRIKQSLMNLLAAKYHFDPTDDEAVHMPDLAGPQTFVTWFFRAVALFLTCCGVLTLSVGGLGAANMMFLIVIERTRDIGLCIALGAPPSYIVLQFFCETLFLVFMGGALGCVLSGILLMVIKHCGLPQWLGTPHISWMTMLITLLALAFIGMAAGYFPARKAARLQPVEALAF